MDYKVNYESWVNDPYFDKETKAELLNIKDDQKEIEDRFYTDLEFGTGGLRGVIGAGTNRMNIYTVRKVTQGLAEFIKEQGSEASKRGVVIAYDSRRKSDEFAMEAALVLSGNGINVYIFDELRPTPELSFAVRYLKAKAGIVITASHNPAKYNGYKVYYEDGGQLPPEMASVVYGKIQKIDSYEDVKRVSREEAENKGLLKVIGSEVDDAYIGKVKTLLINPDIINKMADNFTMIYTPLHGAGNKPVRRVLKEIGIKNVMVVKEQEKPDPEFSTVTYPNPEDPNAFKLALKMAAVKDVDLIVGTDPDSDRVGVVIKKSDGKYDVLTGNQTGCLLLNYILSQKKKNGTLAENSAAVKTIVTTKLAQAIADDYNVKLFNVLTGFKFIGEKINEFEQSGEYTYQFGFEESYGCLAGTFVRDKDAVIASMLISEMACYYKSRNMTLYDGLIELYKKYGYYKEKLTSFVLPGKEGVQKIKNIMQEMRNNFPDDIGGFKVNAVYDYLRSQKFVDNKAAGKLDLPVSNVLYFELDNKSWFCIRPSGTEPKIKLYFASYGKDDNDSDNNLKQIEESIMAYIKKF